MKTARRFSHSCVNNEKYLFFYIKRKAWFYFFLSGEKKSYAEGASLFHPALFVWQQKRF